jgi:hypothetical protein
MEGKFLRASVQVLNLKTKNVVKRFTAGFGTLVILGSVFATLPTPVFAAGEAFTGSTTASGLTGTPIPLSLQVSGTGNDEVPVTLSVPSGILAMSQMTGLVFTGPTSGDLLRFSGDRSDVNAALATLTYTPTAAGTITLSATVTDANTAYNPTNGHIYTAFSANVDWDGANAAAQALTYGGVNGYLATIMSADENNFVTDRLDNDGWMGARDTTTEGEWNWVTGPENGTNFWNGDAWSGTPVSGQYSNWDSGQPDNYDNGSIDEDCGQIVVSSSGAWNDLFCTDQLPYFVAEFGSSGNLPQLEKWDIEITVTANTQSIGDCAALMALDDSQSSDNINLTADIDCTSQSASPLFVTSPFRGTFDGNGHTIRNVTLNESSDNVGIISQSNGATIRDLKLENISVTGEGYVGSLVGEARNTNIYNVAAQNVDIQGSFDRVGGLIGRFRTEGSNQNYMRRTSTAGSVSNTGADTGGLVGMAEAEDTSELLIETSYSTVEVDGVDDVGGLTGEVEADGNDGSTATVRDVYAWGDVSGQEANIGGLIGRYDLDDADTTIVLENAYAYGDVAQDGSDNGEVGGLIGGIDDREEGGESGTIRNSFAMGAVSGTGQSIDIAGFVGQYNPTAGDTLTLENNYFDQTRSMQTTCNSDDNMPDCTAINTDGSQTNYFINNNTNAPLDMWNFNVIWTVNQTTPPTFRTLPANQVSFISPLTGKGIMLELSEECDFEVTFNTEQNLVTQDPAFEYPNGLVGFDADCGTPGFTTTVSQYYYGVSPTNFIARKFSSRINGYFTLNNTTIENVTIDGQQATKVTYQVTDGSERDMDGQVDGNISDPVGLAQAVVGAPNTGINKL